MPWPQNWSRLFHDGLDGEEGFHQEILSAGICGVRVVATVEAGFALIALAMGALVSLTSAALAGGIPWGYGFGLLLLAALTFGLASLPAAYPHNRVLAGVSVSGACVIAIRSMQAATSFNAADALVGTSLDFVLAAVTSIMLAAVTVVPFLPVQTLCIGAIVEAAGLYSGHPFFFAILAVAATGVSAALMEQRRNHYRAYLETLRMSAGLRDSQSKALRGESAGTMVRMTAALAHELSSPIGVLSCGIETFLRLCARHAAQVPGPGQQQMESVISALRGSLHDSIARLRATVNRIQRLTTLDESIPQRTNLNQLATEAVGLMKPHSPDGTFFDLDLRPVPDVTCKPEQIVSVICCALANSFQALNGNGRISVSTGVRDSQLELRIRDNGCGIPPERLAHIFDPRFQVADGRVSTGNWSLFASRRYMIENGGDIRIESMEGAGTTVCLTLHIAS